MMKVEAFTPGEQFLQVLGRGRACEIEAEVRRLFRPDTSLLVDTGVPWEPPNHAGWALRLRRLTGALAWQREIAHGQAGSAVAVEEFPLYGGLATASWTMAGGQFSTWAYRPSPRAPAPSTTDPSELLDRLTRARLFAGVVLIEDEAGRRVYARGLLNRRAHIANDPSAGYNIASITKLLTAIAVLRLVDEGTLDLEGRVGDVVPRVRGDLVALTVRQLLTHTGGLPAEAGELDGPSPLWTSDRTRNLETWCHAAVQGDRGTYAYSNLGFAVLGSLLEFATGVPYFDLIRSFVTAPFGMASTGFPGTNPRAVGYAYSSDRAPAPDAAMSLSDLGRGAPYGYAYSTAEDLARMVRCIRSSRLVSQRTRDALLLPAVATDIPGRSATCGAFVQDDEAGRRWLTLGAGPGSSAWVSWTRRRTIVVLANQPAPAAHRVGRWLDAAFHRAEESQGGRTP